MLNILEEVSAGIRPFFFHVNTFPISFSINRKTLKEPTLNSFSSPPPQCAARDSRYLLKVIRELPSIGTHPEWWDEMPKTCESLKSSASRSLSLRRTCNAYALHVYFHSTPTNFWQTHCAHRIHNSWRRRCELPFLPLRNTDCIDLFWLHTERESESLHWKYTRLYILLIMDSFFFAQLWIAYTLTLFQHSNQWKRGMAGMILLWSFLRRTKEGIALLLSIASLHLSFFSGVFILI